MNPISSSKPYKCDTCSILAVNYYELLKHQIAVHIDKMFQCQSCNKVFDTTIKFEIHAAEIMGTHGTVLILRKSIKAGLTFGAQK